MWSKELDWEEYNELLHNGPMRWKKEKYCLTLVIYNCTQKVFQDWSRLSFGLWYHIYSIIFVLTFSPFCPGSPGFPSTPIGPGKPAWPLSPNTQKKKSSIILVLKAYTLAWYSKYRTSAIYRLYKNSHSCTLRSLATMSVYVFSFISSHCWTPDGFSLCLLVFHFGCDFG